MKTNNIILAFNVPIDSIWITTALIDQGEMEELNLNEPHDG